jgi:DNA-binding NtrC family response regulator
MTRVVIVDDDIDLLKYLAIVLAGENLPMEACFFSEAEAALSQMDGHHPEVIVSDFNMLKMNGLEFLQIIMREYPDIVFILMSGNENPELEREAYRLGAYLFISKKPFNFVEKRLIPELKKIIATKRYS